MDPVFLYIVGTAGSGKSTLTGSLREWMIAQGYEAITVNLDPGADELPYTPDIDIRHYVNLADVMDEFGLGPNGAQVAAADLVALNLEPIKEAVEEMTDGFILVDTPGQIELFTFRQSTKQIIDSLWPERSAILFLFDPFLSSTPNGFITLQMLFATTRFRFDLPMTGALTKIDLLEEDKMAEILSWINHPDILYDTAMSKSASMEKEMGLVVFRMLEEMSASGNLIPVCSADSYGMPDIYNYLQQLFIGGEDVETGFR